MRFVLAALPFIALAACATTAEDVPVAGDSGFVCSNDRLSQFSGQKATQQIGADMIRASGARTIRWVPKDGMVTMDFRPDRLTVQLDGDNRIVSARCG